jgi:alpha-tubulin suppressor-like RCC1 family protein
MAGRSLVALLTLVATGAFTLRNAAPASAEGASGASANAAIMGAHLDAGGQHACAVFVNGVLKCWGRSEDGQLGYGDSNSRGDAVGEIEGLPAVELGTSRTAKSAATGGNSSCAILDNDALKCWGRNDHGQLGLGAIGGRGGALLQMGDSLPAVNLGAGRTVAAVSVGNYVVTAFACAILDTGQVKCWGDNSQGQLGIESAAVSKGLVPTDMGDTLPTVDLGPGRTATHISAGAEHVCVILDAAPSDADSNVKCWGGNDFGQLGLDDALPRGGGANDMATLPTVNLGVGRSAIAIAAGSSHTCAILDNHSVKCWGDNAWGELGTDDGNDYGAGANTSGTGAPVLSMVVLPTVNLGAGRTATAIAVGDITSCAVLDNGQVTCWGDGRSGQLGNGTATTTATRPVAPYVIASVGAATAITLGDEHVCASTADGTIRCWGIDEGGRLGRNTNSLLASPSPPVAPINFRNGLNPLLVAPPPLPPPSTNRFVPLVPSRILDTRNGLGAAKRPLAANSEIVLRVAGRGGVPPTGATAVVLNLTADQAAGAGYVTVYPADVATRPDVSSINLVRADQTVANLVTVQLSADGSLRLFSTVSTELLADVAGYYTPATAATAGRFVPLNPERVFDTRSTPGTHKLAANEQIDVAILGRATIPASGVSALVLNVTVANATAAGYASVWPFGQPLPTVSNLNVTTVGQAVANQVIVPLGIDGKVSFFSSSGADVIVDVAGYFTDATAASATTGLFTAVVPGRVFDSRGGTPSKLGPGVATRTVTVAMSGRGNLPAGGMSAVVINLTATDTGAAGYVSAWPPTLAQPNVSTLNWTNTSDTVPNHATVRVAASGQVSFFASTSSHLLADSAGWYS